MMKQLVIIGGGHAGSSAALTAARIQKEWKAEEIAIHLVDQNSYMTVKPRLYEYELDQVITPFSSFLPQAGVHFHQDKVVNIDLEKQYITGKNNTYPYDALILAAGSQVSPKWEAENVDSYKNAKRLQDRWKALLKEQSVHKIRIAILGAGFTGIELATEMPINIKKYKDETKKELPAVEITLMGHGEIGAALGENPKPAILDALNKANVQRISRVTIENVQNKTVLYRRDGKAQTQQFELIINTLGQHPNPLIKWLPFAKDQQGRILVDQNLRVPKKDNIFMVGDVASVQVDESHTALMTCQQGRPQGRYAGYNAVAFLQQKEMLTYQQPHYVTCLDLGNYGALYTEGWERKIRFSGKDAKKLKKHINQERIYPPANGEKEAIYNAGALRFKGVLETIKTSKFNRS